MQLSKTEERLTGRWIYESGNFRKDEVSVRIEWLVNTHLKRVATDISGWDVLYIDPTDNRLWELIYLESELHGGGPPTLICLTNEEAKQKYVF